MPKTRTMTIAAKDPSAKGHDEAILTADVEVPYEDLEDGPRGHRVHVVDYDASHGTLYKPAPLDSPTTGDLLSDPAFHARSVYATVMQQLARFEFALGRRVSWGFGGHQIYVFPHAFAEANAFYSEANRCLLFGYCRDALGANVYTCLSHDIVAHETSHALLSGLRNSYTLPSSPDQAAFHEGFSDIVALLSVFTMADVVRALLAPGGEATVPKVGLEVEALRSGALAALAGQMGQVLSSGRARALRMAAERRPDPTALRTPKFVECHLRGEVLSGAVLRAFIDVWHTRIQSWVPFVAGDDAPLDRVVEDAQDAAQQLLTIAIRALDYCPVVDIQFGDFLSAMLTADYELFPGKGKYDYRTLLRNSFAEWGIIPSSTSETARAVGHGIAEEGLWETATRPPRASDEGGLEVQYDCVHRLSLERDADEVFRLLWENRPALGFYKDAYTKVSSVRPCTRVGPDGFVLHETVSEYIQLLDLQAGQLSAPHLGIAKPPGMPDDTQVRLHGGGVLIFDEFGRLKYHVRSRINNVERQSQRLAYLYQNRIRDAHGRYGYNDGSPRGLQFAIAHLRSDGRAPRESEWR